MAWPAANPVFAPPLTADEDELKLKIEFAGYLARGASAREAAYTVFRNDQDSAGNRYFGRALQASQAWEADPVVQEEVERQRSPSEVGELHPTPDEVDYEVLELARSPALSGKDRIAAYELYANLRGRATKAATNINVDNSRRIVNVLKVPMRDASPEDDADFETKFRAQQTKLVRDARSTRVE